MSICERPPSCSSWRVSLFALFHPRAFSRGPKGRRHIHRFAIDEVSWISWAVESLGARPWMNALCLPRALAAHAMLRRRGIASRLCLGVARDGSELAAHAWVEIGEDKIVGGSEANGFTRLAEFGGACR